MEGKKGLLLKIKGVPEPYEVPSNSFPDIVVGYLVIVILVVTFFMALRALIKFVTYKEEEEDDN